VDQGGGGDEADREALLAGCQPEPEGDMISYRLPRLFQVSRRPPGGIGA
jgi:hypothetical protein